MKDFETIVEQMLHIKKETIADSLTPKDVPDWDSMNYLLFIAELEKEYGITFTMDEVISAETLGAVKEAVKNKGIAI